jgi:hypothetical protein
MKQRGFVIAAVVAFVVAAGVVMLKNRKAPESASSTASAEDSAALTDSCALTECHFSPVITPAFTTSSEGKDFVGIWNVGRNAQTIMEMKNVSQEDVIVSGLTLSMCLNDQLTPVAEVPEACRYVKILRSDFAGQPITLKPGDVCAMTLETDAHGQIAKLQYDTTRGPVITMITVQ